MDKLIMTPAPGERMLRFVGDRIRFSLRTPQGFAQGLAGALAHQPRQSRTLRQEIIATHAGKNPMSVAFWRDVPLQEQPNGEWAIEMPLTDVGFLPRQALWLGPQGRQFWPDGSDAGISVHPTPTAPPIPFTALSPRMFGPSKTARVTVDPVAEKELNKLDKRGYVVIPPSGTLRDLTPSCRTSWKPRVPHPSFAARRADSHDFRPLRPFRQSLCLPGFDRHRSRRWSNSTNTATASSNFVNSPARCIGAAAGCFWTW